MNIAIVGLGAGKEDVLCRCEDRLWDVYGLPWDENWYEYDLLFEMHDRELWETRGFWYVSRLQAVWQPVIMHHKYVDIPASQAYNFKKDPSPFYYQSSFSYMMAEAISKNPERIELYGVDLRTEEEYGYQRPNAEYLMGYAQGKGIEVEVMTPSSLKEFCPHIHFNGVVQEYVDKYGFLR